MPWNLSSVKLNPTDTLREAECTKLVERYNTLTQELLADKSINPASILYAVGVEMVNVMAALIASRKEEAFNDIGGVDAFITGAMAALEADTRGALAHVKGLMQTRKKEVFN